MRIAVCEDDEDALIHVISILDSYRKIRNVLLSYKAFSSSVELASAAAGSYDLYILDILMPVINGIDLAKEIRSYDKAASILFLTSSSEFALESYTVKAANYLVKPVCADKLFCALDDIWFQKEQEKEKYIVVKSNVGIRKIFLSSLVYAEAQGRRVIFCLQSGERLECISRFSDISDELLKNESFMRPHRSYLLNMSYISTIGPSGIQLQNGAVIPLAQRRLSEIKEHYLSFQMEEVIF